MPKFTLVAGYTYERRTPDVVRIWQAEKCANCKQPIATDIRTIYCRDDAELAQSHMKLASASMPTDGYVTGPAGTYLRDTCFGTWRDYTTTRQRVHYDE